MNIKIITALLLSTILQNGITQENVSKLEGKSGFRSIHLQWKYPISQRSIGFSINYCENQAWGKHRCKKKILDSSETLRIKGADSHFKVFETDLANLRMATNYTVDVQPFLGAGEVGRTSRGRSMATELMIQTKGFSARAIKCLANTSLVEVETGPNFGGKISVEGSSDERCSIQGDYSSTRISYLLTIDHFICGSQIFNTSVRTFVIVQENLPILTHSARRFMVLCNYLPETFTVRAGVNLPNERDSTNVLVPIGTDFAEVDPSELFDSTNSLFAGPDNGSKVGRALKLSAKNYKDDEPRKWSHLALMIVMIISALVGMVIAVWQIFKKSYSRRTEDSSYSNDSSVISGNSESLESSSLERTFNPEAYPAEVINNELQSFYANQDNYLTLTTPVVLLPSGEGPLNIELVPEIQELALPYSGHTDPHDFILDPISLLELQAIPDMREAPLFLSNLNMLPSLTNEVNFIDDFEQNIYCDMNNHYSDLQCEIMTSLAEHERSRLTSINNLQTSPSSTTYESYEDFSNSSQIVSDDRSLIHEDTSVGTAKNNPCAVAHHTNIAKDSNWRLKNKNGDIFVINESAI